MPYCSTCNGRFAEGTFCPKDGTALLPDGEPQRSLVGQVIGGRYRLTKLLGAGGMGEVYAAEHIRITKKVAVKLLHPEISANQEAFIRFQQEARSASDIGHDNIVGIDDFGVMDDGRAYLCMEFLQGESLSDAMQARGGLDPIRALNVMIQVCDGLAAAHAKNIVHRDMKPENVFLTRRSDGSEVAKILDFGIAKVSGTDRNESLTRTGTVFGTPHYMSPEQALGQKLDHRADIYSVGVMLFEIFTGQVPFKAESFMGILSQHITKPTPQPSTMTPGRTVPKPIEDIILQAMAKEAPSRFSTMKEMRDSLKRCLDDALRAGTGARGGTMAYGGGAPPVEVAGVGMQPTMASVAPQQGRPAYQPTMQSQQGAAAQQQAVAGAPSSGADVIPKTMMAGQQGAPLVAPRPTPVPPVKQGPPGKKGHAGLIIGLVGGIVVLGGGAAAAVVFWDKITGKGGGEVVSGTGSGTSVAAGTGGTSLTAGTGSGTSGAAGTGSGTSLVAAGTGSGSGVAPGTGGAVAVAEVKPDAAPKVAVATEPEAAEKPAAEKPAVTTKPRKKCKGRKCKVEAQAEVAVAKVEKGEPKVTRTEKVETKVKIEPPEECCTLTIVSVPGDAGVLKGGKPVGRTPYKLKLEPGETASFTLAKGGHADLPITVKAKNGTQTFRLKRRLPGFIPGGDPGAPGSDPGIR